MINRIPFPYLVVLVILSVFLCWLAIADSMDKMEQADRISAIQIQPLELQKSRIENFRIPAGLAGSVTNREFNQVSDLITEYSTLIQKKGGEIRNLVTQSNPVSLPGTFTTLKIEYTITYHSWIQFLAELPESAIFIRQEKLSVTATSADKVTISELVHLAWFPEMGR